jgi:DNA (cytosine-5)-methyltransferase 1
MTKPVVDLRAVPGAYSSKGAEASPIELMAVNLFAGIEGFGLALHRAGVRTVAAVEIDPAARGVIADRFPETTLFEDVTKVTADELRATGFVPERGIVTGGWPCQGLSVAGLRLGLGDARSGLFEHLIRLLADLRPRWFVLENVPGLLSATCPCPGGDDRTCGGACAEPHQLKGGACGPGRCMEIHGGAMGTVVGSLAGLGYGLAYRVLDAQHFGVPQRRRRVVFVGRLGDWAAPAEVLLEPEGGGRHPAPCRKAGAGVARTLADNAPGGGRRVVSTLQSGGTGTRGYRIDAEVAAGGHLIAGTLATGMGSNAGHPGDAGKDDLILAVAATSTSGSASESTPGCRRGDDENLVAQTLTRHHGRMTPDQDNLVPVAFDPAQNASAENRANPQLGGPAMPQAAISTAAVRRLTPVECERLQGLPDGWTATSNGRPQSDSARYRHLGNSIAVPVFEWVARRLVAVDRNS